jgi:uncharacterized protein YjbI with pentapeptide repeats
LLLLLLAVLAGLALWIVPELQVFDARTRLAFDDQITPAQRLVLENDLFQAENAARSTLAIIFGAGGLFLGIGIVWRRFELSRQLQTHERFARAVEQLGSDRSDGSARTEVRLSGIYALERLMNEAESEYWPIMEVFTAYVRENAPWRGENARQTVGPMVPTADVQAILAVLGRRKVHHASSEKRLLDLRETDLRGANLSGSRLEGLSLQGAHLDRTDATRAQLSKSNLREADLSGATLTGTDLEGGSLARANLEGARLNGARLRGADLSGANLRGADLWEADLGGCTLKDADLRGADLSQCKLDGAILWRADLQDAVLTSASLKETHLERANLAGAIGLTWEQGDDAFTDENTILPEYLLPDQVRQSLVSTAHQVAPSPPTPAARRTVRATKAALPAPPLVVPEPDSSPEEPVHDNVVEINSAARRKPGPTRPRETPEALPSDVTDEAPPKKTRTPRHRKPGLVKPA